MNAAIFACSLLLSTPVEWEATTGFGGLVWEQPVEQQAWLQSSNMIVWSHRRHWRGPWWLGVNTLYNAYDGRAPEFIGPAFFLVDAMVYHRVDLGDWQLNLGAGAALSVFSSSRIRETELNGVPAGRYDIVIPGVHAGIHGALLRRIHPRLLVGVSLRYYSGINWDSCWDGPVSDCEFVDRQTQHWAFGLSLVLIDL
ncbi:hypothetical protein KKD52_06615 [Myxococcota bacterium]|nr:hypothetical protein [Myxococcota bacterium]MBU1413257.1 hypothetical protein [Myxococcota bacterium]MBU1510016.1 hypothetical protein [Myxococcota bacterium]